MLSASMTAGLIISYYQMDDIMRNTMERVTDGIGNELEKKLQDKIDKAPSQITVNLWPVPDKSTYTLVYYYLERIDDAGSPASNNMDVPARYLPCMVAGLAYQISLKKPEVADRIPVLKQVYEEQWSLAADADRDKSSLFFTPGGYRTV